MFTRAALTAAPACGSLATGAAPVRNMATLKQLGMRLKAVTNIQKITKSMKMVSAAKYARAERELRAARPYGAGALAFFEKSECQQDEKSPAHLIVAMTSDRGLCGSVHSNIGRIIKSVMPEKPAGTTTKIICIGDKSRAILGRIYGDDILMHFTDIGKTAPSFTDAATVAAEILNCGFEFDYGILYYNQFKTVVSQVTTSFPIFPLKNVTEANKIHLYDSIDEGVLQSYNEFSLASMVYFAMKENACSEQSARMTAMDGASKNAGEMIEKLTLTYNRTRQAVITRELIEIISGAAALE